ncbi:hypothetical protein NHH03_01905 [Stieleria sp. TO1_6]|uniref:hypothetical protein n=1 Tax=Stieleria tagensis TaxID=2956795 RepID=UPI00209AF2AE|nr:hypothetical protein [Stieleria tagensis]MCO8120475.1 hypothetical protein [Stieleria tagensis]
MRKLLLLVACVATLSTVADQQQVNAGDPMAMAQVWSHNFAMDRPWHSHYYNQSYGQPVAVVVPPTAHMRQTYSWGVSQNLMYPIHHQFGRNASYPGAAAPGQFLPTPAWPSHTDQFGYNYVRGPW